MTETLWRRRRVGEVRWRDHDIRWDTSDGETGIVFAASPSVALMSIANWLSQIPPLAFIWKYFPITQHTKTGMGEGMMIH